MMSSYLGRKKEISQKKISEDESVREWNEQDYEDNTVDTKDNADDGIEELEDNEVIRTTTDKNDDHGNGKIS